jgi:hypothetical protein
LTSRSRSGRPKRSVSRAEVRRQILVFVEGAHADEEYIVNWHRLNRTHVRVTIAEERGAPTMLVDLAVKAKSDAARDERRRRGAVWDEIWCVFDAAEHLDLREAIVKAEANGVNVAVSDPCIELWFILHFEEQTAHIGSADARLRSSVLLSCLDGLSDAALDELAARYLDARTRAKALDEQRSADGAPPHSNPSTDVWKLVERIRERSDS